jgi:hypothetical protein
VTANKRTVEVRYGRRLVCAPGRHDPSITLSLPTIPNRMEALREMQAWPSVQTNEIN